MLQPSLYTAASPPVKDEPKLEREPEKALVSEQQQLKQRRLSPPQHQVLQGTSDARRHELKQEELDQAELLHHCQAQASFVERLTPAVSAADTASSRVSSPAEDRKDSKAAVSTVSVTSITSTYPLGVFAVADHSSKIPEHKADCRVSPHSESQAASAGEEQAGIVKVEPTHRSSAASNTSVSLTNGIAGVASSVSPEPMSNGPPPPVGHPRQHVSYPEQHQPTYSQAPMPSGPYGYSPITTQPPMDPYRPGQQQLPPNHAMALPSMRSLAPLQHQQQQHHQHPQHAMSMNHAPIPTAYYAQHMMNPYTMGPDLRFALPLTDPRIQMSGGRSKKAKVMKVDELCALAGPPPPPPQNPAGRETLDEILKIYYEIYVPGLASFFETHWYNFKPEGTNPSTILTKNANAVNLLASFLDALNQTKKNTDAAQVAAAGAIETRVVWGLATLAYTIPAATNPAGDDPLPQDNGAEVRNRLHVFETLLSGTYLNINPCVPPPRKGDPHRIREFEFWYYLAESLRVGEAPSVVQQREAAISRIRNLLDGRENRDVCYSIRVLRELAPKFPPGFESSLPQHLDEGDQRNRLAVAAQFIKDEARTSGGTTNVVRRLAELAIKAFIAPGVNIVRRPS
ncbi:hypothetical protein PspLS_02177 [Pyricularia sp. CBS 133598]|nr:hypothetical protein PspLS_02177 [Pyricularia sp. CBS 133598]